MHHSLLKQRVLALLTTLVIATLLAACGGASAPAPEAVQPAEAEATEAPAAEASTVVTETTTTEESAAPAAEIMMAPDGSAAKAVEAAKQYAGTTLNITWESGLQAQDPLLFSGPLWEQLTGIQINVIEVPFTDLYSKAVAEHLAGTGAYDVISYSPAWTGDLADSGVLEPLDDYIAQYMNPADLEDVLPTYRGLMYWKGTNYGLFDDGDVFVMYYRKDWFEDATNQAEFSAQFGRDLTVPTTWQEWDEACQFFTEKMSADGAYGCGIQRAEGQAYMWFMDHFRANGGKFFDDAMAATINDETGVQTLAAMVNSNQYMPPGIEKWGFIEILSAWMDGKLGMIITWPPIGRWSAGYGTDTEQLSWVPQNQIAGNVGYAVPPGGHPELAGGFNLGVSSGSANKEAAYLFVQWLQSPEVSLARVKLQYALRDPYRMSHFNDEGYQTLWPDAPQYLETLLQGAEVGVHDLGIPGAREYEQALDRAVTAAYAGTDPQAALDTAAAEWNEITERIGTDAQKAAYDEWVSSRAPNVYPAE
jgi:multiple sugar transport system substrate-binding protein